MTRKLAMVLLLVTALAPRPAAALETDELLALVAMPLAVAAVSEVTDVPADELINFVSLLNDANVPPTQFVEVVRYVPVALIDSTQPDFVEFVRSQQQAGVSGETLVTIIEDRYRDEYGLQDVELDGQAVQQIAVFDDGVHDDFVPAVVRNHPHGGPPGQLKKERGLQTGAEVVHGAARADGKPAKPAKVKQRDGDDERVRVTKRKPAKVEVQKNRGRREVKAERREERRQQVIVEPRGNAKGNGGGSNGNGGGNGKGNGGGKKGKG